MEPLRYALRNMNILLSRSSLTFVQVIDAMQPWKDESQFGDFIAEQSTFPTAPPSPQPGSNLLTQPRKQDLDALQRAYAQLQKIEKYLNVRNEDAKAIQELMNFVRGVRKLSPSHTAAQRFEMLNPLRAWLFWVPVMLLQSSRGSPSALTILAHYYTVALVVEPLFPEVGAAYFGSLSLGPIEAIARRLFSFSVAQSRSEIQSPMQFLEYPIDMVTNFRNRMGWIQPQRTASFPTFEHHYGMEQTFTPTLSPYGNPAFTYSAEHLMSMPPDAGSSAAIIPLTIDPYSTHYLGIPSPSGFGGYHSPASSNFGEGSVVYSEHGDDFALYDQGLGSSFGGFVPPTIWT